MRYRLIAPFVALLVALTGCVPGLVSSTKVTGTAGHPASVIARDIGISHRNPGTESVTWLFGDTIMAPATCDGKSFHNATGATDQPDGSVGNVTEPVDACGAPRELYDPPPPLAPSGARRAYWPDSIFINHAGQRVVFDQVVDLESSTHWPIRATRACTMVGNHIDPRDCVTLFPEHERSYASGAKVVGELLYLYASELDGNLIQRYYVTRVPRALYNQRAAYTFWDGTTWNPLESSARPIVLEGTGVDRSGGLGGMTVTHNPHLGKYLMTHSQAFGQDLMLRTATSPQGPWSVPTHIDVPNGDPSNPYGNYSAREHPAYRSADGRTIYVTYQRSRSWLQGEMPIVKVVLR